MVQQLEARFGGVEVHGGIPHWAGYIKTRNRKYDAVVAKTNKEEMRASSRTFKDGLISTVSTQVTKTIAIAIELSR